MKWRQRASRNVVEAVVAAFRDPAEASLRRLWSIRPHEWKQSYHWLDASGMALYFLDQLESLHLETVLPATTLSRLRGNLADNRERSSAMFAEWASLNQSFQAADLLSTTKLPSEDTIRTAMNGHLCRCGTYPRILTAIQQAAVVMAKTIQTCIGVPNIGYWRSKVRKTALASDAPV